MPEAVLSMQIETKFFGRLEVADESIFRFPSGMPGFEEQQSFVFLKSAGMEPLLFMQSMTTAALCFIALPILAAEPHYQLQLCPDDRSELQLSDEIEPQIGRDILCAAILCPGGGATPYPTANLLAPIVVNLQKRIGIQAIQNHSAYSHQHPILAGKEAAPCS